MTVFDTEEALNIIQDIMYSKNKESSAYRKLYLAITPVFKKNFKESSMFIKEIMAADINQVR